MKGQVPMPYPFERLDRDRGPVKGHVFVVMPYGKREFVNDSDETIVTDFDQLYEDHYVPVIESLGMTPVRADSLYSDETILGNVWCGLQEGDIVVVELHRLKSERDDRVRLGLPPGQEAHPAYSVPQGRAVRSAGTPLHPLLPAHQGNAAGGGGTCQAAQGSG